MDESIFNKYASYYDLLNRDKDYTAEVGYVQDILSENGITKGNLLEFGSGTGRHGSLLAECGYKVHGIELSAEMVLKAQKASGFTCQQGDIATVKTGKTYDAVFSLFHVLSYQVTNAKLHAVFSNAADHLTHGGIFLFDFWYSPAVCAIKPTVRVKRIFNNEIHITRIAEPTVYPNENRVDVDFTVFIQNLSLRSIDYFKEIHSMRHFSLPELDSLARIHGFDVINSEEYLTRETPSESTWGVCITLRKI